MRNVLIVAFSLVAFAGSAQTVPKHKWFGLNYATGACEPVPLTPQQFYTFANSRSGETGTTIDQIGPEAVTKHSTGTIHVHLTGNRLGGTAQWDFLTDKDECDKYVVDQGIAPEQAPAGDIN